MVTVQNGGDVNVDNVTVLQNLLGIRNTMTNDFVDAGTDRLGKWLNALATRVSQGSTLGIMSLGPTLSLVIKFQGANTGFNHWLKVIQ